LEANVGESEKREFKNDLHRPHCATTVTEVFSL